MKVLVIPDVHLKPWMFTRASKIMDEQGITQAVCLMDIADDWKQQLNLELYAQTYDAAIRFAKDYPNTLWCYGNHDVCYLWNQRESGYSKMAARIVCDKLRSLKETLPDGKQLAFIHRIDNVLFLHGGLRNFFVETFIPEAVKGDIDQTIGKINRFGCTEMWQDISPIWHRPQHYQEDQFMAGSFFQVVGHTPVRRIYQAGSLISCDVFSTDSERNPFGTQEFLLIDTITGKWNGLR